jgi:hypothetical protein
MRSCARWDTTRLVSICVARADMSGSVQGVGAEGGVCKALTGQRWLGTENGENHKWLVNGNENQLDKQK